MAGSNDQTVATLVDRLAKFAHADTVILFGSRGRGDHSEHSDYDICVLVPANRPSSTRTDLWKAVGPFPGSVDLVVLDSAHFERHRLVPHSLEHAIDVDGKVLYRRKP